MSYTVEAAKIIAVEHLDFDGNPDVTRWTERPGKGASWGLENPIVASSASEVDAHIAILQGLKDYLETDSSTN